MPLRKLLLLLFLIGIVGNVDAKINFFQNGTKVATINSTTKGNLQIESPSINVQGAFVDTVTMRANPSSTKNVLRLQSYAGTSADTDLRLVFADETGGGAFAGIGFGLANGGAEPYLSFSVTDNEEQWQSRMIVTYDGNVGIGVTPSTKLEVAGTVSANAFSGDGTNITGTFPGWNVTTDVVTTNRRLGVQVKNPTWNLEVVGSANIDNTLFVSGNRVGIGISAPLVPLHVNAGNGISVASAVARFFKYDAAINSSTGVWSTDVSIIAESDILSKQFFVSHTGTITASDKRMKKEFEQSNNDGDLALLKQIQITNYKYKDHVLRGDKTYKKVVAQQVESIYPIAIVKRKDIVPDIYRLSETTKYNINTNELKIFLKKHRLKTGEKVQLVLESGKKLFDVQKTGKNWFVVNHNAPQEKVFVYGREVDDFRLVDYDALSMLNISATQELAKQNEELKAIVDILKKRLDEIEKRLTER